MTLSHPEFSSADRARPLAAAHIPANELTLFGFTWDEGALIVRKTGVRLPVGFPLIWEISHWAFYLPVLAVVAVVARLRRRRSPFSLWYTPDRAGPWYLLRGAALWAGYGVARVPEQADAAFYFDDTTRGSTSSPTGLPLFNGACTDISKSHVAEVFEDVFGYPLRVDPRSASGPIVEKAEKNGVHDGRVVVAPLSPRAGYTYQRLVDTTGPDGLVHDLRTPCVGGAPVVVWEKTKPVRLRFTIHNSRAALRDPVSVYSPAELEQISAFTARMGLDWGGLDILRDRADDRIYIVDVNKTDLGPVIALRWGDKLRSMQRLSRALSLLVEPASAEGSLGAVRADAVPFQPTTTGSRAAGGGWRGLVASLAPIGTVLALSVAWMLLLPRGAVVEGVARYAQFLRDQAGLHPILGLALFVLAYAVTVSSMLPAGLILIFAGGFILGPVGGAAGSMTGATLGAAISYGMGRMTSAKAGWGVRIPALRSLHATFIQRPFRSTLSLRLMPLTPFTLISLAAGASRVGLTPFALGTLFGVAPECVLYAAIGGSLSHGFSFGQATLFHPLLWVSLCMTAILVAGSLLGRTSTTPARA